MADKVIIDRVPTTEDVATKLSVVELARAVMQCTGGSEKVQVNVSYNDFTRFLCQAAVRLAAERLGDEGLDRSGEPATVN